MNSYVERDIMNMAKKDLYCVIAFAVLALIAIITFWLGGKGNEIVSYISFASAIVSIVLALVAIIYSIIQNVNSQQNIGEMRTLVSEASRIITEKAGTLADQAMSMEKVVGQLLETSTKVSGPTTPLTDEKFSFDASNASDVVILLFYYLAKCNELNKLMDLESIAALIESPKKPTIDAIYQYMFFGIGILNSMECFLESKSIVNQEASNEVEIRKLPPGFQENISSIITSRMQDSRSKPSEKTKLEIGMKKIDALVEAA